MGAAPPRCLQALHDTGQEAMQRGTVVMAGGRWVYMAVGLPKESVSAVKGSDTK